MKHQLPEFWSRGDILAEYAQRIDFLQLSELRAERWDLLKRPFWSEFRELLAAFSSSIASIDPAAFRVSSSNGWVSFGEPGLLTEEQNRHLHSLLTLLKPWRKGPFQICGTSIDAEWRSNLKWDRVEPHLPDLTNKLVLDIGCSNGYYMYRALEHQPRGVLGIDPSEKFLFAFELFQTLAREPALQYELLRVQELGLFPQIFDVAFCFGILYHHRDPLGVLKIVFDTMRSDSTILVESQAIPGDDSICLCPPERYAKQRNVYFIPTGECIRTWMSKVGFKDIEIVSSAVTTSEEQRRTEWMEFESLDDYLDPDNPDKTVEGYDAPIRVLLRGIKP